MTSLDFESVGFEDLAEMMPIELHVVDGEDSAFHAACPSLVSGRWSVLVPYRGQRTGPAWDFSPRRRSRSTLSQQI